MIRSAVVMALALAAAAPAAAQDWRVVPEQSVLGLRFRQGSSSFEARFERFTADIRFDPADLAGARVIVAVDVASFRSDDRARDGQATSAPWLAATQQPTATYHVTAFRDRGGGTYEVDAELTLKGVTRKLTHPVTVRIQGTQARAEGAVTLQRGEFGIGSQADPKGGTVGLEVEVRFQIQAVRP